MKKYVKIIAAVLIYIICMAPQCFSLSKIGSRGEEVRQIQIALVKRGYYIGTVDGIFGTRTEHVLKHFQRHSGLTPDGIAGPETLAIPPQLRVTVIHLQTTNCLPDLYLPRREANLILVKSR